MKIDKYHLKNVPKEDLLKELDMIDEEMADRMFPLSYTAAQKLREYKCEIEKELQMRDATPEERETIEENIKKISKPTGINFYDYLEEALEDDDLRKEYEVLDDDSATPEIGFVAFGVPSKITNGSKLTIGKELQCVAIYNVGQHFNWFQKLMWKWAFGIKVEDFSEE